jgi:hypothetical protein
MAEADEIRVGMGQSPLKVTILRAASPEQEAQAMDAIIHLDRARAAVGLRGVRVVDLRTHPGAGDLPQ